MDVGHDTPDKQGDNCLQPASENYKQFIFSLKAMFGKFGWKIYLEILFCLYILFRYLFWIYRAYVFEFGSKRHFTFLNYTRLYLKFCYLDILGVDFWLWGPI